MICKHNCCRCFTIHFLFCRWSILNILYDPIEQRRRWEAGGERPPLFRKWGHCPPAPLVKIRDETGNCAGPENSTMIACKNKTCSIKWFHPKFLKIIVIPKGNWYCPDCRLLPSFKKSKHKKRNYNYYAHWFMYFHVFDLCKHACVILFVAKDSKLSCSELCQKVKHLAWIFQTIIN